MSNPQKDSVWFSPETTPYEDIQKAMGYDSEESELARCQPQAIAKVKALQNIEAGEFLTLYVLPDGHLGVK